MILTKKTNKVGFSQESNLKLERLPCPLKKKAVRDAFLHPSSFPIMKFHPLGVSAMSAVRLRRHNKISDHCLMRIYSFNAFQSKYLFVYWFSFISRYILSKISLGVPPPPPQPNEDFKYLQEQLGSWCGNQGNIINDCGGFKMVEENGNYANKNPNCGEHP